MEKWSAPGEPYDLVFMDIIMPKLDGISATVLIRNQNVSVPVIALTSNIRLEDMKAYFQWGEFQIESV